MPERIVLSSEDTDDDSEQSIRPVERVPKPLEAKSLGELFVRPKSLENEKPDKHLTFWDRLREGPDHPGLLAAMNERAKDDAKEEDDDDDEEDDKSKAEKVSAEKSAEETEPVKAEESAEIEAAAKLTPEEEKEVVKTKLAEETPEPTPEAAEATVTTPEEAAVQQFHEALSEKLEDPAKTAQESIEEAAEETIATVEAIAEPAEVAEGAAEPAEPEEFPLDEPIPLPTPEAPEPDEEDDAAAATTVTPPVPPTPPTPTPTPSAGGGGSGGGPTPPPYGGPTPSPFGPGGPGGPIPPYGPYAPPTPNVAPTSPDITPDDLYAAERRGQIRGVVAGGIVGYLFGRHRGRVRTERQLLPVQKKLEQQVEDLHQTIAVKEQQIRGLAREKAETMGDVGRSALVKRLRPESTAAPAEALSDTDQPEVVSEQPEVSIPQLATETIAAPMSQSASETRPLPEARSLPSPDSVPELFRNAEALPRRHVENVERMDNQELLRTSEKVLIDGTSLRTIYEAKRITETGLKHVLAEFLSGGDIKRALNQELLVKQLTYERDPRVRDNLSAGYGSTPEDAGDTAGGGAAATAPQQLSAADGHQAMMDAAGLPTAHQPQQSDIPDASATSARKLERMIVGGWVLLVAVLVIVVIILLKHRGMP